MPSRPYAALRALRAPAASSSIARPASRSRPRERGADVDPGVDQRLGVADRAARLRAARQPQRPGPRRRAASTWPAAARLLRASGVLAGSGGAPSRTARPPLSPAASAPRPVRGPPDGHAGEPARGVAERTARVSELAAQGQGALGGRAAASSRLAGGVGLGRQGVVGRRRASAAVQAARRCSMHPRVAGRRPRGASGTAAARCAAATSPCRTTASHVAGSPGGWGAAEPGRQDASAREPGLAAPRGCSSRRCRPDSASSTAQRASSWRYRHPVVVGHQQPLRLAAGRRRRRRRGRPRPASQLGPPGRPR